MLSTLTPQSLFHSKSNVLEFTAETILFWPSQAALCIIVTWSELNWSIWYSSLSALWDRKSLSEVSVVRVKITRHTLHRRRSIIPTNSEIRDEVCYCSLLSMLYRDFKFTPTASADTVSSLFSFTQTIVNSELFVPFYLKNFFLITKSWSLHLSLQTLALAEGTKVETQKRKINCLTFW